METDFTIIRTANQHYLVKLKDGSYLRATFLKFQNDKESDFYPWEYSRQTNHERATKFISESVAKAHYEVYEQSITFVITDSVNNTTDADQDDKTTLGQEVQAGEEIQP